MVRRHRWGARYSQSFLESLQDPGRYDHPVDEVVLIQTHISSVLLAGDYVYKFKKPVDFGFLDFTTLAGRAYFCHLELVLNRRLCPDVYLGLVRVTRSGQTHELNGPGQVVDYGVLMKRLPEQHMMHRKIADQLLDESHLDQLVDTLTGFYGRAASGPGIERFGTSMAVAENVLENLEQLRPFIDGPALPRSRFERISSYSSSVLKDHDRFSGRIRDGRIREGHGDLHSANICFGDKVYVFDCIEFSERFRCLDIASDVAFVAMDLDYHGLESLADYFLERFAEATGDVQLGLHIPFYKCYRACVRAKVNLLGTIDPTLGKQGAADAVKRAARYLDLAESYVS